MKYSAIYPGIDLVYYGNTQSMEFDLIVAAGAHTEVIGLALDSPSRIDQYGNLVIGGAGSEIILRKPRVYQQEEKSERSIDSRYVLTSAKDGKTDIVRIALANYDRKRALTIGPQIVYSSFFDQGLVQPSRMAVDSGGLIYITGFAYSPRPACDPERIAEPWHYPNRLLHNRIRNCHKSGCQ